MDSQSKKQIRISVRALVEFLLRAGDIEAAGGGLRQTDAMLEGARIHRKVQKSRGPGYLAEVSLKYEKQFESFDLLVEGRADGVENAQGEPSPVRIEEIKGVYRDLESLSEPVPVHLAQAKCYAAIYARQERLEKVCVRVTYVQMESEEEKIFDSEHETEEIWQWFEDLLEDYRRWAELEIRHRQARDASMTGLEFPFPYREGQRDMVVAVYRTILHRKQIFAQAPTGVGKTLSAVFPAVRALGEGEGEKIFYLTAKTIARTVAEEAFAILRKEGLVSKTVTLTAKEKICPMAETVCDPERCPYAKGHYDRVNEALYEMLSEQSVYDRGAILAQCEKHRVCPHEFQLDLTLFADAVIGDYNYVFDPQAKLRRFFAEGKGFGDYIFLIDEAHNLAERGREMFSAELSKEEFLQAKRLVKGKRRPLERALERCNRAMLSLRNDCEGECREIASIDDLLFPLMNLMGQMEETLSDERFVWAEKGEEAEGGKRRETFLEIYFHVRSFLSIADLCDEHYLIYGRTEADGSFRVKLFCVDPSANLQAGLDAGRAAVFFSATLLPLPYYRSLLSARDEDYAIYIPSPFDAANRLLAIGTDVSSKYTRRGREEYTRMAAYVHTACAARPGRYLVFFPSYQMLEAVADLYETDYADPETRLLRQEPGMTEREREDFLAAFGAAGEDAEAPLPKGGSSESIPTTIGFCVMGGIFAEGIDLVGEKLIGAIVIGTGLPQIGDERELLRAYYDRNGKSGFDYAYRLPGMNKVLQAAGRVIRDKDDRGVILLLDDRFTQRDYRDLFPREWADRKTCRLSELPGLLRAFWGAET